MFGRRKDRETRDDGILMEPVATFYCSRHFKYDTPRQGNLDQSDDWGRVSFHADHLVKQAILDLQGFDRIWLLYYFHKSETPRYRGDWKPMTRPPRAPRKFGVFATRGPYRPNGLGLSCVRLEKVDADDRNLWVREYDLIDGTPILDVKPYIPRYDSFPDAKAGWVDELDERPQEWIVSFGEGAQKQCRWLAEHDGPDLMAFAKRQLAHEPMDGSRKRIEHPGSGRVVLAYRTWRLLFHLEEARPDEVTMAGAPGRVRIEAIFSGYSPEELARDEDPYDDKELHHAYIKKFGSKPPLGPGERR